MITADGVCWAGGLFRSTDDGVAYFDAEEIVGPDRLVGSHAIAMADDGTLWATVHSRRPGRFEGLARYDGSTWEQVAYDPSVAVPADDLAWTASHALTVGPDGTVWVVERKAQSPLDVFVLRSWDGDAWMTYGPVEVSLEWVGTDAHFLDDGSAWFLDGQLVLDARGLRSQKLPGGHVLVFGPDGSAWTIAEGSLYVITPEAVTATE